MKMLKLTAITLPLLAAASLPAAQTNLVQNLTVGLIAYVQGPTTTNGNLLVRTTSIRSLSTPNIIKLLGNATANNFSALAGLRVVQPLPDGNTTVEIRDGTNKVDVTAYFTHEQTGSTMIRGLTNIVTGVTAGGEVALHTFGLVNGGQALASHYEVSGVARISFSSVFLGSTKPIGEAADLTALVSGTGDLGGTNAVFQGLISIKGRRTEIVGP